MKRSRAPRCALSVIAALLAAPFALLHAQPVVSVAAPIEDTLRQVAPRFVLRDDAPPLTLLYQNFPNPFPTAASTTTCVWFDLSAPSTVRLDVYDLRGGHVRTLHPSAGTNARLPAGRYGRSVSGGICDERFAWDGRSDTGAIVAPGVYLLRLRAGRTTGLKRMLFRGR